MVDAQRYARQGLAHVAPVGQDIQQVAADAVEHVQLTPPGGIHHFGHEIAPPRGHGKTPQAREASRRLLVHGQAPRQLVRHRPHLRSALHARMATDGHEARAGPAHHSPGQGQVDDGPHVVHPVLVHGDAHRPDEYGRAGVSVQPGELQHLLAGGARRPLQLLPGLGAHRVHDLLPAAGVGSDEVLVRPALFDEVPQHAVEEADVPSDLDLEESIGHSRAQQRRVQGRGYPVSLHARLAERVHHRYLGAPLLGQVDVLHGHGLVVGYIATDEHQQVALQPVAVAARGSCVAQGLLEGDGAGCVADTGRVIDVVGAQEPGHLLGHIVGLVDSAAGGEVEGDTPRVGVPQAPRHQLQRLLPLDGPEAAFAPPAQHGRGQPAQGP